METKASDRPATEKVVIIGARGIGRHHANWWTLAGVNVAAFAGTSPATVRETEAVLKTMFGFSGSGYIDVAEMIRKERPTYVDVCSPPPFHFEHVRQALEAGVHVLCEKPFLFDSSIKPDQLREQASTLVNLAESRHCRLALCSQYSVAAESCLRLFTAENAGESVTEIEVEVASPGRGRTSDPATVWIDLGPHLLAAIQAIAPQGELIDESWVADFSPDHARCSFEVTRPSGPALLCRLHAFRTQGEPSHVRRITLDSVAFDLEGERRSDGVYQANIVSPYGTHIEPDPMHQLIVRMAAGNPSLPARAAAKNLDWLLRVVS